MQPRNIFFLLVVLILGVSSGLYVQHQVANDKISYGLDVRGGIRLIYQMDASELNAEQRKNLPQLQSKLQKILTNRASGAIGVAEPVVNAKGTDQFVIELPGFTNKEEAQQILSNTAKVICYWAKNVATQIRGNRRYTEAGKVEIGGVEYVQFARTTDTAKVMRPGDPEYAEMIKGWEVILEGEDVADARPVIQGNRTQPEFNFSADGARKMEAFTRRYLNQRENIAFVLDGRVLSIAPIKEGAIITNSAFIDGDFPPAYVNQLTELIRAGSLPVPLKELASEQVDPTIGKFALDQMLFVGAISAVVIGAFLIVYYAFPGLIALIALILYGLLTVSVLSLFGATFSLAAIAALILSLGMAVDANILVFERFKEEMREKHSLERAVELGFKRALPAIVDSNVCTILTAAVLGQLGTGPVKGFATTLILGVALSLFTAIVVTRSLLLACLSFGIGRNPKYYALGRNWFGEHLETIADQSPLKVIANRGRFYAISIALVVPGLVFLALGGMKMNVEFLGGFAVDFSMPAGQTMTAKDAETKLSAAGFDGANVKFSRTDKEEIVNITLPPSASLENVSSKETEAKIADALGVPAENTRGLTTVGPSVQRETVTNAITGVVVSLLLIVVYLGIRFGVSLGGFKNGLKFSLAALVAVFQAVLVVLGTAATLGFFLKWEIGSLFLSAMLTVIGFQVHDTIVIFDRIRENLRKPKPGDTFGNVCDRSVAESIARSINTSATVVVTLLLLIAFGTPTIELKFFCVAMATGIIVGTYGSIFLATPVLWQINEWVMKRSGEQAGFMAEAIREQKVRAAQAASGGIRAADLTQPSPATAGYGTVKRRSGVQKPGQQELDD